MKKSIRWWSSAFAALLTLGVLSTSAVVAFQVRPKTSRFDTKVVDDPSAGIDTTTLAPSDLPATSGIRATWDRFRIANNGPWSVYLDRRSGTPLLVEGQGIRFPLEQGATVESIGLGLRSFIGTNRSLLKADDAELVLDQDGSGQLSSDVWQIVFKRVIAGVPVVGQRYVFTLGHGNLMSFGTPRWSRIDVSPFPDIDASEALGRLTGHMGLSPTDAYQLVDKGSLQIIPLRALSPVGTAYTGPVGSGYGSALVWRIALKVDGDPGTWAAQVDAHTGDILSFEDVNDYAQTKGGVFPVSDDGLPPDGIEQANWPMPYANITIGAGSQFSTSSGLFNCTPGGSTATTTLAGQFVRVVDTCGPVSASVTCDGDLNLGQSAGTDCVTPGFGGNGNTHASRTSFYHLNRIAEHARVWLPTRTWLTQQLVDNINLNQTCNAYWNGSSVNFFKSGGGCRNTGEIAGVFLHEWGHGLDSNDGGGTMDNPSEAYADITAMLSTHVSCVGRGFFMGGNCSGYGDACLNCTGIRDQDWNARTRHRPATPAGNCNVTTATNCTTNAQCPAGETCVTGFLSLCPSGAGPCGKEVHCEAYVSAEAIYDLATRDLPATGLDLASSWQLTDKLWYKSRLGSGGNAYTCAFASATSDGCAATSWFSKIRAIDDDDGNLANGTPHAAAIFAAFNRHKIACGTAADASNQSTSSCPAIGAGTLTSLAGSGSAILNWTPVANATAYNILRNDASCDAGSTIIAVVTAPTTTYTDTGLANGFTEFYRVQAVGANPACDGLLSNCQGVTPQPFAGVVKFDRPTYSCSAVINVTVTDGNIGGATASVKITSGAEPGGETITVTQVTPGSADYTGVINTTAAPAAADGAISVADGDTIVGTYIDADDGIGGTNITRTTNAGVDCVVPIITNVQSSLVTGMSARITWNTNEGSTSTVHFGLTPPPAGTATVAAPVTAHQVDLTGLNECSTYVYSAESSDPVGNTALDDNVGTYYSFNTLKNTAPSYVSTDTPVAIPDNDPTGATSTIAVPDNKPVVDVNVTINITHTYDGDLIITLQPPVGAAITLFNRNPNTSGDNFTATVFDDAAATSITAGAAPFTGTFRPVTPLSAANGINAAGSWRLKVVDAAGIDVGTIDSWTLSLTFPAAACGPHALLNGNANVGDACATGGAGNADTKWDPGEDVNFKLNLNNDGTTGLTNVTATVTSPTPGVVMTNGTASFPDIATGASSDSNAPHFTAHLPNGLACNSTIAFNVTIHSDQGTWTGSFSHGTGLVTPAGGTALNETFAGGIPATWTVVNGGSGGGAAQTWTTANPGGRAISSPMSAPVAIVDSDNAGSGTGVLQDEELITPAMDFTAATSVTLSFDQFFRWYSGGNDESADVDVRSTATGNAWVNVLHQHGASSSDPDHKTINIGPQAIGAPNVQVRFHYYNGHFEWYWIVDNVKVDFTALPGCNQTECAAAGGVAKPVADGSYGTAMTATRIDPTHIGLTWDVATCTSTDHHVLYGDIANVSLSTVSGAVCDLGATGTATWSGVPGGDIWFVVVGDDNLSKEASWGLMTSGERGGATPSGQCGMSTKDIAASCP